MKNVRENYLSAIDGNAMKEILLCKYFESIRPSCQLCMSIHSSKSGLFIANLKNKLCK